METLRIVAISLLLLLLGLCIEWLRHMEEASIERLTMYLLYDIGSIFTGVWKFFKWLFSEPKTRHWFDESLMNSIKDTADPYVAQGFQMECEPQMDNDKENPSRYISIKIVAKQDYTDKEIGDLADLELRHLRNYLNARNYRWRTFATYNHYKRDIHIMLYYSEYPDEDKFLIHRYKVRMKEAMPQTCGTLVDEELNQELEEEDKEKDKGKGKEKGKDAD